MSKSAKFDWDTIRNLQPSFMADAFGPRLLNNIDVAARRPAGQRESFTTVAHVDRGMPLGDLMRIEDAVSILQTRIRGSRITLLLTRWIVVENADTKHVKVYLVLKIRAGCGRNRPLSEANLTPVRAEYRRLLKERAASQKAQRGRGKK